jgi:hypothetical protein
VIIDMLMACVILHNMVIEDEKDLVLKPTIKLFNNIQMRRGLTTTTKCGCSSLVLVH